MRSWLEQLEEREPEAYVSCLARILELADQGHDLRRPSAAHLGNQIYELRVKVRNVQYRMLYFFLGRQFACLTHGFIKKGAAVPDVEIHRTENARKLVRSAPDTYTEEFEV